MKNKKLPTIFERIFLSHLIVIVITISTIVWLYIYLIGADLRIFLKHSTVIMVPLALFLVGIAGLIAVWATRIIVQPLEKTTDALQTKKGFTFPRFYEEIDELISQIESHQRNSFFTNSAYISQLNNDQMNEIITSLKQSISSLAHRIEALNQIPHDPAYDEIMNQMKDSIIQLTYVTTRLNALISS